MPDKGEGTYMCVRPALRPIAKIWYHFIRTHLIPTTHIETVNKDRLILLHCILEGKKINIGKIIQREISTCAFKPKGCLFFLFLITELYLRSRVEVTSSDEVLANNGAIITPSIKRFSTPAAKPAASRIVAASQPQGDLALKVEQLTQMLQHHMLQQ